MHHDLEGMVSARTQREQGKRKRDGQSEKVIVENYFDKVRRK